MLDDVTHADLTQAHLAEADLTGLRWPLDGTRWPGSLDVEQLLARSAETEPGSGIYVVMPGPTTIRDTARPDHPAPRRSHPANTAGPAGRRGAYCSASARSAARLAGAAPTNLARFGRFPRPASYPCPSVRFPLLQAGRAER